MARILLFVCQYMFCVTVSGKAQGDQHERERLLDMRQETRQVKLDGVGI
jgi:hypothetical protein